MKNKGKKGFTIVEIVIALSIISIASLTATSLVIASQEMSKKTRNRFFAIDLCNNSVAVFQSSVNDGSSPSEAFNLFGDRMSGILGLNLSDVTQTDTQFSAQIYFDSDWVQIEQQDKLVYSVTITAGQDNKLTIKVRVANNSSKISDSEFTATLGATS